MIIYCNCKARQGGNEGWIIKSMNILYSLLLYYCDMSEQEWRYPNLPPSPFVFARTPSLLDESNPDSALNRSQIRGFFNLAIIFLWIFFVTQPVVNFMEHGYFLDTTLYSEVRKDFLFCAITWPLFFLWYT